MKKNDLLLLLAGLLTALAGNIAHAFEETPILVHSLPKISAAPKSENISITPLGSNKDASDYVIFIKENVKAHYHAEHTELVYVLAGTGTMQLGKRTVNINAGDYIRIPPKMVHAVKVTSKKPLKVLSIQTPEFDGKDRHFVD
mgnify:CR=1 FL=1